VAQEIIAALNAIQTPTKKRLLEKLLVIRNPNFIAAAHFVFRFAQNASRLRVLGTESQK
jgi:hypothetical protein